MSGGNQKTAEHWQQSERLRRWQQEERKCRSMDRCIENVLEFLENQERATVTFSQGRYKSRIRKLAEQHPDKCQIVAENKDGSLLAHIPTRWIRIVPSREYTEEQKQEAREQLKKNIYNADCNRTETRQIPSRIPSMDKLPFEE